MRAANCAITSATRVCPDRYDDPQPYPDRPRVPQHVVVCTEDANRHRDEGERNSEDLKGAESPFQLGLVATVFTETVNGLRVVQNFCHLSHLTSDVGVIEM